MNRCNKQYGKRRELRCGRPTGHKGRHARSPNVKETGIILMKERRRAN